MTRMKALRNWLAVMVVAVVVGVPVVDGVGVRVSAQATVTPAPAVPSGAIELGTVRIPRRVMANGESLAAGTHQIRVTPQEARPEAAGQTPSYERWVEFVQGGEVRGKDVLSIVPSSEIGDVAESSVPAADSSKVELLKGNDYLRIWINRDAVDYLIHLPVA